MLEWLIIGGGVHGTHLSHVLVNLVGVERDRVVVLDPCEEPLGRWKDCTAQTGMSHLRSPVVHHIGLTPMELLDFSRTSKGREFDGFRPPYDRPSLGLFEAHCEHVCESGGLREIRETGWATDLRRDEAGGFCVETDQGPLKSRRVILAMGSGNRPCWPEWAGELKETGGRVWHIFDEEFEKENLAEGDRIAIVGLGISAAQLAVSLSQRREAGVTVIGRHPVKVNQFDSEPCWLGPKCQSGFRKLTSYRKRRRAIEEARHRGSMPQDVALPFKERVRCGGIEHLIGQVERAEVSSGGEITIELQAGEKVAVDSVVLATGFGSVRPDQGWLSEAIERLGLRCAECGYPIVDEALQWTEGLHVSGPLAELELGPAARNIAGARMTGRRILSVI